MKRTKDNDEKRNHYQKVGGGSLRLPGRLIKPNQKFYAFIHELPKGAKDVIVQLDVEPGLPNAVPVDVEEPEYTIKHRSGGFYHVLDANGKQLTEEALKKEGAEQVIADLKAKG